MFISRPSDCEQGHYHKKKLSTPPICPSNQVTDLFTSTLGALPGLPQIYTDKTELDTARYLIWTQHDLLCYSRLEMWSSWSNLHNGRSGSVWGNKQRCPRSVHSEKHRWQTLYLKKIADVKTDYKIRHKTKNRVLDGATNGSHCTAYILVCVFTNTEHWNCIIISKYANILDFVFVSAHCTVYFTIVPCKFLAGVNILGK